MNGSLVASPVASPGDSGASPDVAGREDNVTMVFLDLSATVEWMLEISHHDNCRNHMKRHSDRAQGLPKLCSQSVNK